MSELRTHVPSPTGHLCGAKSGMRAASFLKPTCGRCESRRPGLHRMYVALARELLKTRDVISAGQVAYAAHGQPRLADVAMEVEQALADAGFARASWTGGRFSEVSLWRLP